MGAQGRAGSEVGPLGWGDVGWVGCPGVGQWSGGPSFRIHLRIAKRPEAADAYLTETIQRTIFGKQSIVQQIQHSTWFSQRFNTLIQDLADSPIASTASRIRSLSAAKHRFRSRQTPLSRAVLFMEALLAVSVEATYTRQGRAEGTSAAMWLDWVDAERLFTLGLLADSGDEGSQLIDFFDAEAYDISEVSDRCSRFVHHIDHLFVQGKCVEQGYTQFMVDFLSVPRVLRWHNQSKVLDCLTAVATTRCLNRMRCWVALAIATINAEFPSWHVLQAFRIFGCQPETRSVSVVANQSPEAKEPLTVLAKVFGVDPMQLQQEYSDVLPVAQHIARSDRASNLDAWLAALKKLQASRWAKKSHPLGAILPVFHRYAAWQGCSTSGQERTHAKQQLLLSKQRRSMQPLRERDETKLFVDLEETDLPKIIAAAQRIWSETYGASRLRLPAQSRIDAGVPKVVTGGAHTGNFHKHFLSEFYKRFKLRVSNLVPAKFGPFSAFPAALVATAVSIMFSLLGRSFANTV